MNKTFIFLVLFLNVGTGCKSGLQNRPTWRYFLGYWVGKITFKKLYNLLELLLKFKAFRTSSSTDSSRLVVLVSCQCKKREFVSLKEVQSKFSPASPERWRLKASAVVGSAQRSDTNCSISQRWQIWFLPAAQSSVPRLASDYCVKSDRY